ncbi:unnamed protein product [Brassica napus]|uniref:(rape) hypothetical protein n=1 Tax=Brassica napus TaxID=3708 RepID=A0A816L870_BRANA|nr:unnamed protein product [Brassica napus]
MASRKVIITSPFIFRQICRQIRKPKPWAPVSFPSSMRCFFWGHPRSRRRKFNLFTGCAIVCSS